MLGFCVGKSHLEMNPKNHTHTQTSATSLATGPWPGLLPAVQVGRQADRVASQAALRNPVVGRDSGEENPCFFPWSIMGIKYISMGLLWVFHDISITLIGIKYDPM